MSFLVITHVRPSQLKRYVEDHYWGGGKKHLANITEAVDCLFTMFSLDMTCPFNISLSEVMCRVAEGMGEGTDSSEFANEIFDEVEEIFEEAEMDTQATDVAYHFYLFCPMLYHYLIDEEQIQEFHDWKLEMITIKHNRVDMTFRD